MTNIKKKHANLKIFEKFLSIKINLELLTKLEFSNLDRWLAGCQVD